MLLSATTNLSDERNLLPFLELVGPAVQGQDLMQQFLSLLS